MFDTHCHLTDLEDPRAALLGAFERGVGLLCFGYHAESCGKVAGLRAGEGRLQVGYGLHPWFAQEPLEPILDHLETPDVSAVGEIGLDLWKDPQLPPLERQRDVFEVQLQLAQRLNLPVSLHSRGAVEPLTVLLRQYADVRGVLHAFSGSIEQALTLIRLGHLVGIGGAVTRPRARRIRRLATELPLESLVLETDCPAIGMEGRPAETVRPWNVQDVAVAVAQLRGMDLSELAHATDENARRIFGFKSLQVSQKSP